MLRMSVDIGKIPENDEELVPRTTRLKISDLEDIVKLGRIDGDGLLIERSPKGYRLKTPTRVLLSSLTELGEKDLADYIIHSLIRERPSLIPFALGNKSIINLANYLLRYRSQSLQAFYTYTQTIKQYSDWLGHPPDRIIEDTIDQNGLPDPKKVARHAVFLEKWVGHMQSKKLTPGRVYSLLSHTRTWYKTSRVSVGLPYSLPRRVTYKDRSPQPEELERLLAVGDLREKLIVSMTTLGGFREETLTILRYRHVKDDLEAGVLPIHVHVEASETKGKYHDYDTFLGGEAPSFLRLHFDSRRRGSPMHHGRQKIPPETIDDESPLIRDSRSPITKGIGPKQVRKIAHDLYLKAGLIQERPQNGSKTRGGPRNMYTLRFHTLRKFFRTQMQARGVQENYVEYFMGHTVSTYNDIQSLGVDKLRQIYASANLSIRPRREINKLERIREFAEAIDVSPEKIQRIQEIMIEPDTKLLDPQEQEKLEIRLHMRAIRDELLKPQSAG